MTTYYYTLKDSSAAKAIITDVIKAEDIRAAYSTVMSTINQFNLLQPEYTWKLVTLVKVNNLKKDVDIFQLDKFKDNGSYEDDSIEENDNTYDNTYDDTYDDDLPF